MLKKKNIIVSAIILLSLLNCLCTQTQPIESQLLLEPVKPQAGELLKVIYTAGINSPLSKVDSVTMQALFVPVNHTDNDVYNYCIMNEITMKKKDMGWIAEIIPDQSTGCIIFQFESDNKFDNNKKKGWDIILYSQNEQPVKGAYSTLSQTLNNSLISSLMDLERDDTDSALVLLNKEILLYPDNWFAKVNGLNLLAKKAINENNKSELQKIENEIDLVPVEHPQDINLLEMVYIYYYRSDPIKSRQILKLIEKLDPQNTRVLQEKLSDISHIEDYQKRLEKLKLLDEIIWNKDFYSWYSWYYYSSEVFTVLEDWKSLVKLDEKTIEKIKTDNSEYSYFTKRKKKHNKDLYLFSPLNSLAVAYHKLNKNDLAEKYFKETLELDIIPTQRVTILENYLRFLVETKQFDTAIVVGQKAIEDAESNEKIIELFKTAYSNKGDEHKTVEQSINEAKNKAGLLRYNEIANLFITNAQLAPDFTLRNSNGKNVSLSSLRDKIVIIDFWATWCGPCKKSFPFLQKFYDLVKNDTNIVVLTINSWETGEGEQKLKVANNFIKDNSYTLPVLFDIDNQAINLFGVTGIPTKYFIGPDGKIYFKEVGFNGPSMVEDMKIMVDIIRKNKQ